MSSPREFMDRRKWGEKWGKWFLIALLLFASDFFSKYWAYSEFYRTAGSFTHSPFGEIEVFRNFLGIDFCIGLVTNWGGAWGILATHPRFVFVMRIVLILFLCIYILFFRKENSSAFPFLSILTGAIGNVFDHFLYGFVIDMLHFTFFGYSFPVFNVADLLIFFGVVALFYNFLRKERERVRSNKKEFFPSG